MKMEKKEKYGIESIKVLEGLEGVRKRPAMYIGSTGKEGLHHLVFELVDNSVDEAIIGECNEIVVKINKDGSVSVEDNGRGIPVEEHPQYKKSGMEIVFTKLHAGGKFDHKTYAISGGLHGVGASVVNALSSRLIARVKRNNNIYEQSYEKGKAISNIKIIGKSADTGTMITFWPDREIFSSVEFDFNFLASRLRELAFLNPGLKIILIDERNQKREEFFSSGGIIEFIKWLNKKEELHKPIYFKKESNNVIVEVSLLYNNGYDENIQSFVNTVKTTEGGTHVVGFKTALTKVIADYISKKEKQKEKQIKISGDDTREGLLAVLSLKLKDPQFEGQTKTKLGNNEVKGIVESITTSALSEFFEENPAVAKRIISKVLETARAREAAKKAKELVRRKGFLISNLPGKLADCSSRKTEKTELYIVEGESAAGSSKQARNKEFQAILPLRGKILNVEKAAASKIFANEEIGALITAIGTGIKEEFNIDKIRYEKIIILCDADVDGQHLKTLLLTFFFRYMPQLIEKGHIYVAMPPLYKIRKKKDYYVYSDGELKNLLKKIGKASVQRFKGLGEMNPQQLWETTMSPNSRILKKVKIEDAAEADRIFSILMGENVEPRKQFIIEHANEAILDI